MAKKITRRGACQRLLASAGCMAGAGVWTTRGTEQTLAAGPSAVNQRETERTPARGPLKAHPTNPRYFADGSGKAILLAGSHNWANLVDLGVTDPPAVFDFGKYLDFLTRHNHNFFRLWRWELSKFTSEEGDRTITAYCSPHPWERTGPGVAFDGRPKFDLNTFDEAYFSRLRARVKAAGERGIYVSVMLFEGWESQFLRTEGHPFRGQNNIQGIKGEASGDKKWIEINTLNQPEIRAIQEVYLRKVIDTVNDLDNVLYETCNEAGPYSTDWQYHMIEYVKSYEAGLPKQHPVGMTFQYQYGSNTTLFNSPADWISPNPDSATGDHNYRDNPPAGDGRKVIVSDTDHLWGVGGDSPWVWKSFLRGLNFLYMDPLNYTTFEPLPKNADEVRRNLGYARQYAQRMDLANMTPQPTLCSTGYCLAKAGAEYLAYQPEAGSVFTVELQAGSYDVEWFDPGTGRTVAGDPSAGGRSASFTSPFTGHSVLYLKRRPA